MYWCVSAVVSEIQIEYSYGRYASNFITEHNLDNSLIFSAWGTSAELARCEERDELLHNTSFVGNPVVVNAYFSKNICFNLNLGNDDEAFMHYKISSEYEDQLNKAAWRNNGDPDIIIGKTDLEQVYDDVSNDAYTFVDSFPINYIWKTSVTKSLIPIYARKDIISDYNLEPIGDDDILNLLINGFTITDDMREQYENGVPIGEILKPYLDAMFGEE